MRKGVLLLVFLLSCFLSAHAQGEITGKVVDAFSNESIIGATVLVKGTTIGTVTDADGKFIIKPASANPELEVRYMGYVSVTVPVNNRNNMIIELKEDVIGLEQVVVIGYGVQKKSDLTGAISSINADDIRNIPTTNITQALQGRAAGVEVVQNSGSPGSSTSIRIRGAGTVNNSDPLYVVDGMLMDNINFLASDDIASIEVLKDASSSAIYGSRGANGVVLITTKSGSGNKKPLISFNSYLGWQEAWKNPDIMTKDEFIYFEDYASNQYSRTRLNSDGTLSVRDENQALLAGGSNWWNEITQKGLMQKYNLSFLGGSKDVDYYISGSYMGTEGIVETSSYDRFNLIGKVNVKLSEKVTVGANMNYSKEDRNIIDEGGEWGIVKQSMIFNPLSQTINSYGEYIWNTPIEMIRRTGYDNDRNTFIGQITFNWDILPFLKLNSRAGINTFNSLNSHFERSNRSDMVISDNSYSVKRTSSRGVNLSWDNILTYSKTFNEVHNLSAMIGQVLETNDYETFEGKGSGYGGYNENYDALDFAKFNQGVSGYSSPWRALGFIARLSYDYAGKYLVQSNFRADGSSKFEKNRWGYFPSFSVGWKLSGEEFMKDIQWLSLLKIRAGWGQLGNNRVGDFVYGTYVKSSGYYIYGNTRPNLKQAMEITQIGNPDITWERTQSTNIGVDFNILNNRFSSGIDLFNKDTRDMLIAVPLPYYTGFRRDDMPLQNAGGVNNKGIEIQLAWADAIEKFRYKVGGNVTHIQNKVTALGENNEPIYGGNTSELKFLNKTSLNVPIGSFYGWKTNGIIQEGEDISKLATFKTDYQYGPGDMKYVDINKDGVIDDADKTYLGSPHPTLYYGFNVNLEYAGFDLDMFFQGVYGNKIYNATKYYLYSKASRDGLTNVAGDYLNKVWRGTPGNPEADYRSNWSANFGGTVPAPNTNNTINDFNFRNSDFYIEDGSYLRMKNIQLGYTFNTKVCNKLGLTSLRMYAAATNLFTWTKYTGLDPEIGKTSGQESNNLYLGIDQGLYPQARTYTFGLILDL